MKRGLNGPGLQQQPLTRVVWAIVAGVPLGDAQKEQGLIGVIRIFRFHQTFDPWVAGRLCRQPPLTLGDHLQHFPPRGPVTRNGGLVGLVLKRFFERELSGATPLSDRERAINDNVEG